MHLHALASGDDAGARPTDDDFDEAVVVEAIVVIGQTAESPFPTTSRDAPSFSRLTWLARITGRDVVIDGGYRAR